MTIIEIHLIEPEERASPFPPSLKERIVESLKEKISKLSCILFKTHFWMIQVSPWEYSEISSVDDFRKKRASRLKCKHCSEISHVKDVNLTHYEYVCYKWQTNIQYKYFP